MRKYMSPITWLQMKQFHAKNRQDAPDGCELLSL